jgi:molybdopterin-binding protein
MSQIRALVSDIRSLDNLNIVRFTHQKQTLLMVSLELRDINVGDRVILNIKSSHIALAKDLNAAVLSFENQLDVTVKSFEIGSLLCTVRVDFDGDILECLLTKEAFSKLDLKEGVKALIFASDISIQEVLNGHDF